jgi:hypothetical protein
MGSGRIGSTMVATASTKRRTFAGRFSRLGSMTEMVRSNAGLGPKRTLSRPSRTASRQRIVGTRATPTPAMAASPPALSVLGGSSRSSRCPMSW